MRVGERAAALEVLAQRAPPVPSPPVGHHQPAVRPLVGRVVIQREGPGWHEDVPRERPVAGGVARVVADTDAGDGFRAVHVEYEFPDAFWTQTFLSRPLTTAQFERLAGDAGLSVERYLTSDGGWAVAAPA